MYQIVKNQLMIGNANLFYSFSLPHGLVVNIWLFPDWLAAAG